MPDPPSLPARVPYTLGEVLGAGAQGNTYRAVHRETGAVVAIKVLTLRGSSWKGFDLFERECDVLASLDHPTIPRYIDRFADEDEGRFGLVMELVEGQALAEHLRRRRYPTEERLWEILEQSLDVLDYLHRREPPVIHRDLKPANLLERPDGRIALVDFGGVRVALRPEGGSTMVGTFGYMAPEQLHGAAQPATDIYSLGASLAALTCGREADRLPRSGLKIDLQQVMTDGPLRDVLARMLEPDPADRLSHVAAVHAEIAARRSTSSSGSTALTPVKPEGEADAGQEQVGGVAMTVLAGLGYTAFTMLELVFLPLITALLGLVLRRPDKRARLQARSERIRAQLREGRRSMRELPQRHPRKPPRQLPPPARPMRRQLREARRDQRRSRR